MSTIERFMEGTRVLVYIQGGSININIKYILKQLNTMEFYQFYI